MTVPTHIRRNQSMECFKLVAALLVILIHASFPGKVGNLIAAAGDVAVPMFFVISGYFTFGADQQTLKRRLKHLLRLYLLIWSVLLSYGVVTTELTGGSSVAFVRTYLPDLEEILRWIIFHVDPRNGQLWYLTSACFCYGVLWLYVGFFGNKQVNYAPLYIFSAGLMTVYYILASLCRMLMEIPHGEIWRNGLMTGLPMVSLGIFLRQYQETILVNYNLTDKKLALLAAGGGLFALVQHETIGYGSISPGNLIEVVALLLLFTKHPVIIRKPGGFAACVSKFGSWSTYMYLLHLTAIDFYARFLKDAVASRISWEAWVNPVVVIMMSFLAAVIFEQAEQLLKKRKRR